MGNLPQLTISHSKSIPYLSPLDTDDKINDKPRFKVSFDHIPEYLRQKGIHYKRNSLDKLVEKSETMVRQPIPSDTHDAKTTLGRRRGDCDDLAVLNAYELQKWNKNPNLEFGLIVGFQKLKFQKRELYTAHAMLVIKDKRYPNRYELYETTDLNRGLIYAGSFNRFGPNNNYPTPRGNKRFIINYYVPVKNGKIDSSVSPIYFVPKKH